MRETRIELGWALYRAGELTRALELFEQSLERARDLDDDPLVAEALFGLCQLLLATGQVERAEPLARELQNDHFLADCAQHRRDYRVAERHRVSALEAHLASGDAGSQVNEVFGIAMVAAGLGRDEDAVRLEGAVDAKWEELGLVARPRVLESWRERDLGAARARLGDARAASAYEEGRAMEWAQVVELALGKSPTG